MTSARTDFYVFYLERVAPDKHRMTPQFEDLTCFVNI